MDTRFATTEKAVAPPPHSVQQRDTLGYHGYGLYELEPIRSRDREFGHICTRMRIRRKVVVGYWQDKDTQHKIAVWMRVCAAC